MRNGNTWFMHGERAVVVGAGGVDGGDLVGRPDGQRTPGGGAPAVGSAVVVAARAGGEHEGGRRETGGRREDAAA